jgi:hypothetical protein
MDTPAPPGPAVGWDVLKASPTVLQPGDIVHMRWRGFIGSGVRWATRRAGEPRTWVNHSALLVANNPAALLIEAVLKTRIRQPEVYEHFADCRLIVQRHPDGLTPDQQRTIVRKGLEYEGDDYGVPKAVLHLLDHFLGDRYVFRRLARDNQYPICSWVVAYAYGEARLDFGVEAKAAAPDDIMDYCVAQHWPVVWIDRADTLDLYYRVYPHADRYG